MQHRLLVCHQWRRPQQVAGDFLWCQPASILDGVAAQLQHILGTKLHNLQRAFTVAAGVDQLLQRRFRRPAGEPGRFGNFLRRQRPASGEERRLCRDGAQPAASRLRM